jgi:hypothetical protein
MITVVVGLCIVFGSAAYSSFRSRIESLKDYVYDSNRDVQYHESAAVLATTESTTGKGIWVKNPAGNVVYMQWSEVSNRPTYYAPDTYRYGATTYVPTYEESVYLRAVEPQYQQTPAPVSQ